MSEIAKSLIKMGGRLFSKRETLMSLWQEQADNFYPERADFTNIRTLGDDFANNLTTSFPILTRRELGSSISAMLRPSGQEWFHMGVEDPDSVDLDGRRWLEHKDKIMRKAMYKRSAQFVRATKEADNDFVTFGNAVISTEINRLRTGMLYRCWHLRDVAWMENVEGIVDNIHRKWNPTARELHEMFGKDALHQKVTEFVTDTNKDPYTEIDCRHIVIPIEMYQTFDNSFKALTKYVSIYIDVANDHIIEVVGSHTTIYTVPRWQTVSGSQYGYSPATIAALPDARLIQAMTLTLLEAGEKAVNPPMIAQTDVIRSDISYMAGGVTWVSEDYDERLGDSLRPINQNYSSLPYGIELREDIKASIMEAFYLNKLNLPPSGGADMTAYEVGQRVQEYIRNALPLFEPMEMDYNGGVCEQTAELMMREGAFGSMYDIPESLKSRDVEFQFESPLHDAVDKQKAQKFLETKEMLAQAAELDPGAVKMVDGRTALRETLEALKTPATWMRGEAEMQEMDAAEAEKINQQQMLEMAEQGSKAAANAGKAAKDMSQAQQ